MSVWSSCNAIIYLYTYKELPAFKELVSTALTNAPKITGREGDCVYTAIDFVAGVSGGYPCTKCPIYNTRSNRRSKTSCPGIDSPYITKKDIGNCFIQNLDYPIYREITGYYDRCKIVVSDKHGLRDKTKEETKKEFNDFVKYLKNVFNGIFKVEIVCKNIR